MPHASLDVSMSAKIRIKAQTADHRISQQFDINYVVQHSNYLIYPNDTPLF